MNGIRNKLCLLLAAALLLGLVFTGCAREDKGSAPKLGASVVTDGSSTFVIKADNSLWAFGRNGSGQLGDGTLNDRTSPVHILDSVADVIPCGDMTYALKTDGALYAWGRNDGAAHFLGDGTTENRLSPVRIMEDVVSVHPFSSYTFAINAKGELWGWGYNANGELGDGSVTDRTSPVRITDGVRSVRERLIIKNDDSLWYIGTYSPDQESGLVDRAPKPVKLAEGVASFAGDYFLTTENYLVRIEPAASTGTGAPAFSRLADNVRTAISIPTGECFFIKNDDSLWAFGDNTNGIIGDGSFTARPEPVHIMDGVASVIADQRWDYSCQYVFAIKKNGELYSWGEDCCGSLGRVTTEWPETLPVLAATGAAEVVTDGWSTFLLKKDGTLHASGYNGDGLLIGHPTERARLGDGSTENRHEFVKIMESVVAVYHGLAIEPGDGNVNDTFLDYSRTFALTADGSLFAWGSKADGLLGTGDTETALSPVKLMDGVRVK